MSLRIVVLVTLLLAACGRREPTPSPPSGAEPTLAPAAGSSDAGAHHPAFAERTDERARLVRQIASDGVENPRVLSAMRKVPRHAFVSDAVGPMAYADRPLPIGSGQTISQPFIVAYMTEAVAPTARDRCLEIGTGSGYQAAVLAELCRKTYSIEYIPELAETAKTTLRALGYAADRLELRTGDGYAGWPEAAPFDVIVVTAAPARVPQPLLDQLAVGGRLVIPVGSASEVQALERWKRRAPGSGQAAFERERLLDVRFVPFLGDAGG